MLRRLFGTTKSMNDQHLLSSSFRGVYISCEIYTSEITLLSEIECNDLMSQILKQYSGSLQWKPLYQCLLTYLLIKTLKENKGKLNNYELEDSFWFYLYTYLKIDFPFKLINHYRFDCGSRCIEICVSISIRLIDLINDPFVDKISSEGIKEQFLMLVDNHIPKLSIDFAKNSIYLE